MTTAIVTIKIRLQIPEYEQEEQRDTAVYDRISNLLAGTCGYSIQDVSYSPEEAPMPSEDEMWNWVLDHIPEDQQT